MNAIHNTFWLGGAYAAQFAVYAGAPGKGETSVPPERVPSPVLQTPSPP